MKRKVLAAVGLLLAILVAGGALLARRTMNRGFQINTAARMKVICQLIEQDTKSMAASEAVPHARQIIASRYEGKDAWQQPLMFSCRVKTVSGGRTSWCRSAQMGRPIGHCTITFHTRHVTFAGIRKATLFFGMESGSRTRSSSRKVIPSTRRPASGRASDYIKATSDHLNLAWRTVKVTGDHFYPTRDHLNLISRTVEK